MDNKAPKVVLLGATSVGKTTLIKKLQTGIFIPDQTPTTSVESFSKEYTNKNGEIRKLSLWDTAGQERYDTLSGFYVREAFGVIICFDLTFRKGFEQIEKYFQKLEDADEHHFCILVGTKYDQIEENPNLRKVTQQEAQKIASQKKVPYIEISSKTDYNIPKFWNKICKLLEKVLQKKMESSLLNIHNITLNNNEVEKKRKCC
ncbi:ras-related protein rab-5b-related [Anaeramoeba ignava]|uniref:Ras-related protein rab-5b-related n=1 Tax=Anaeramoeba ignava TaxID=1746090 RepID=A0A9Q0RHN4_ANAIG|nr:ras-related protein rab-5b-related [Anaeramoeba ignava]